MNLLVLAAHEAIYCHFHNNFEHCPSDNTITSIQLCCKSSCFSLFINRQQKIQYNPPFYHRGTESTKEEKIQILECFLPQCSLCLCGRIFCVYTALRTSSRSVFLSFTPTTRFTSLPSLNKISVGIEATPNSLAIP